MQALTTPYVHMRTQVVATAEEDEDNPMPANVRGKAPKVQRHCTMQCCTAVCMSLEGGGLSVCAPIVQYGLRPALSFIIVHPSTLHPHSLPLTHMIVVGAHTGLHHTLDPRRGETLEGVRVRECGACDVYSMYLCSAQSLCVYPWFCGTVSVWVDAHVCVCAHARMTRSGAYVHRQSAALHS